MNPVASRYYVHSNSSGGAGPTHIQRVMGLQRSSSNPSIFGQSSGLCSFTNDAESVASVESIGSCMSIDYEKPETWTNETDKILVTVDPFDDEYWEVTDHLQKHMKSAHISKLWRIQNSSLWWDYSFCKESLSSANEQWVWHGTRYVDPVIICNDGFKVECSKGGMWGYGTYFAEKSSYSNNFAYRPSTNREWPKRCLSAKNNDLEILLVKLSAGNEIVMVPNPSLRAPPHPEKNQPKYNTVRGKTEGSNVWIIYENGLAYPEYLVRYYLGRRDPKRTPYASRKGAVQQKRKIIANNMKNHYFTENMDWVRTDIENDLASGVDWLNATLKGTVL